MEHYDLYYLDRPNRPPPPTPTMADWKYAAKLTTPLAIWGRATKSLLQRPKNSSGLVMWRSALKKRGAGYAKPKRISLKQLDILLNELQHPVHVHVEYCGQGGALALYETTETRQRILREELTPNTIRELKDIKAKYNLTDFAVFLSDTTD